MGRKNAFESRDGDPAGADHLDRLVSCLRPLHELEHQAENAETADLVRDAAVEHSVIRQGIRAIMNPPPMRRPFITETMSAGISWLPPSVSMRTLGAWKYRKIVFNAATTYERNPVSVSS